MYTACWLLIAFFVPAALHGIVRLPHRNVPLSGVNTAVQVRFGPSIGECGYCLNRTDWSDRSFTVEATLALAAGEEPGWPTRLFFFACALSSGACGRWWVGATSDEPITALNQTLFADGCFGAPGGVCIVACGVRDGVEFRQGDRFGHSVEWVRLCWLVGGSCNGSCGALFRMPAFASHSGELPSNFFALPPCNSSSACGAAQTSGRPRITVPLVAFLFVSAMSLQSFLITSFPPIAALARRLIAAQPFGAASAEAALLPVMRKEVRTAAFAVVSVFGTEGFMHLLKNLLGVALTWFALVQECERRDIEPILVHYVVDNSPHQDHESFRRIVRALFAEILALGRTEAERVSVKLETAPSHVERSGEHFDEASAVRERIMSRLPEHQRAEAAPYLEIVVAESDLPLHERFLKWFRSNTPGSAPPAAVSFEPHVPERVLVPHEHNEQPPLQVNLAFVRSLSTARGKGVALHECGLRLQHRHADAHFVLVMDARHAPRVRPMDYDEEGPLETVWPRTVREFFGETGRVQDLEKRFVQIEHAFLHLKGTYDVMNRRGADYHHGLNVLRGLAQTLGCSGTNSVFSLHHNFVFPFRTCTEDHEASAISALANESAVYIEEPLVAGSAKSELLYTEALVRWPFGNMQWLFCEPHLAFGGFIMYVVVPAVQVTTTLLFAYGWVALLLINTVLCSIVAAAMTRTGLTQQLSHWTVRLANTTYPVVGTITAVVFMLATPLYLCIWPSSPLAFNIVVSFLFYIFIGALQFVMSAIVIYWSAGGSHKDGLTAQRGWFALWPLNLVALYMLFTTKLGNLTWSVTQTYSMLAAAVNLLETAALLGGIGRALYTLVLTWHEPVWTAVTAVTAASSLFGVCLASYSLWLLYSITMLTVLGWLPEIGPRHYQVMSVLIFVAVGYSFGLFPSFGDSLAVFRL